MLLIAASEARAAVRAGRVPAGGYWVFAGEDYPLAGELRRELAARGTQELTPGLAVNDLGQHRADEYVACLSELGRRWHAAGWPATGLSTRHTMSMEYLDCCRLLWLRTLSGECGGQLTVVCARPGLLRALQQMFPAARCLQPSRHVGWRETARRWLKARRPRTARRRLLPACPPATVVIRTWADDRAVDSDGRYRDIYFGLLPQQLQATGESVLVLATVATGSDAGRLRAAASASGLHWLTTEDFPGRPWSTFARRCLPWPIRFDRVLLDGTDISAILAAGLAGDYVRDAARAYDEELVIWESLARAGLRPSRVLFPMENQIWAHALCEQVHMLLPQARCHGYQHAALVPGQLFNYRPVALPPGAEEPDRLVVTGPRAADYLRRHGHRGEITVGGAWRFTFSGEQVPQRDRRRVLVALPYFAQPAIEMLLKAVAAAQQTPDLDFMLRPHPVTGAALQPWTAELPANCRLVAGHVTEALAVADVVVYSETTLAIEAVAAGIAVACFVHEYFFVYDPLAEWDDPPPQSSDILQCVAMARVPRDAAGQAAAWFSPPAATAVPAFI